MNATIRCIGVGRAGGALPASGIARDPAPRVAACDLIRAISCRSAIDEVCKCATTELIWFSRDATSPISARISAHSVRAAVRPAALSSMPWRAGMFEFEIEELLGVRQQLAERLHAMAFQNTCPDRRRPACTPRASTSPSGASSRNSRSDAATPALSES